MSEHSTIPTETRPGATDKTVEEALQTVANILDSERTANEARQAMAGRAEVIFEVTIRNHHDGKGYCVVLEKLLRATPTQVMWRKRLT